RQTVRSNILGRPTSSVYLGPNVPPVMLASRRHCRGWALHRAPRTTAASDRHLGSSPSGPAPIVARRMLHSSPTRSPAHLRGEEAPERGLQAVVPAGMYFTAGKPDQVRPRHNKSLIDKTIRGKRAIELLQGCVAALRSHGWVKCRLT